MSNLPIDIYEEKLMSYSTPRELVQFVDIKFLKIILIEHFYKNKNIEYLSKTYGIPELDIKFFLNSAEAFTLLKQLEEETDKTILKNRSIEELKETMINKLETLMQNASNRDAIDAIDRITPRIIEIEKALTEREALINNTKRSTIFDIPKNRIDLVEGEDYVYELDTEEPKLPIIDEIIDDNTEEENKTV